MDRQRLTDPARSLAAAVEVMDQLRLPGGCPWDAEQTHTSLLPYLLEESYELIDAVEAGDQEALRSELGDVLLQVLFHARIAAEHPAEPFDIADVANTLVAKLKRRHPHVFGDVTVTGADEVATNWTAIKAAENTRRSVLDGIPRSQGALTLAQQVLRRAGDLADADRGATPTADVGEQILALVATAQADGIDAETALRAAVRRLAADIQARETES